MRAQSISYEAVQGFCRSCEGYRTVRPLGIVEHHRATLRLMRHVSNLCRFVPAARIPEVLGLSAASAWRYDRHILQTERPPPDFSNLEAILIDEKYLGRSKGFITCVLNARSGELLFMGEGRNAGVLDGFFDKLDGQAKASIKAVGVDRAGAYKAAVERRLPHADIVFDKFHLVANYNEVIDRVRRRTLAEANARERKFAKGQRHNLFRNPDKLDSDSRQSLVRLLASNSQIAMAYMPRDSLRQIWNYTYVQCARRTLENRVALAMETSVAEIKRYAKGLLKAKEHVVSYCKHRITSARIEAFNRTISRTLHKTCGVSNTSYLFLKLRQYSLQN